MAVLTALQKNEITDDLAKLGEGQPPLGIEPDTGIPYTQIKEYSRQSYKKNNKACLETKGCRQAEAFIVEAYHNRPTAVLLLLGRH